MTGRDEGDVGELRPSPGCRVHGLQSLQRYSIVQLMYAEEDASHTVTWYLHPFPPCRASGGIKDHPS